MTRGARVLKLMFAVCLFWVNAAIAGEPEAGHGAPQYVEIKSRLAQGWNTWNTSNVLQQVLLPEGFAINLCFKQQRWLEEAYLSEALIGREGVEEVRPGPHAYNGLELQDVGLTSLLIADTKALMAMARLLGRDAEPSELGQRAESLETAMAGLWDEATGFYLNRRTDTGDLSKRLSPTLFYPLLARLPDETRARRIITEHFFNPDEFWGEHILPSIARNDPDFPRQRYWKGAIWPPLNFLTYLDPRNYATPKARAELANRSLKMFLGEWRRKGFVSENSSSISGTGDDARLSSDRSHSWGALFGFMAFIEQGLMPAPENPIK